MIGKKEYSDINENLNSKLNDKKILIAVHRGVWGGNIVENTKISYKLALEAGGDMFECDLSISTDGKLYVFHDGGEKRLLKRNENILTMSSKEIKELIYQNSIVHNSAYKIESFEDVLEDFNDGELFNIDRCWKYLKETTDVLKKYPSKIKQVIIKTPVKDEYLEFLDRLPEKYMYMPIVYNMAEVEKVLSYKNINLVGMELIAKTSSDELFLDENIAKIKANNIFVWANAITLSGLPEHILFGGLDDDLAIMKDRDASWGEIARKNIDVIQTDWPTQLNNFLISANYRNI